MWRIIRLLDERKKKDRTPEEARSLKFANRGLALQGEQPNGVNKALRGPVCSNLLRGCLSRHRSLLLGGSSVSAATAAAAIAVAGAAAVATMAMMATMATAVAAVAAVAAIAAAALVMTEGHCLAVTTNQRDANDREEHRESQHNNTIHPQILQLLTGTVSETTGLPSTAKQARQPTAQRCARDQSCVTN